MLLLCSWCDFWVYESSLAQTLNFCSIFAGQVFVWIFVWHDFLSVGQHRRCLSLDVCPDWHDQDLCSVKEEQNYGGRLCCVTRKTVHYVRSRLLASYNSGLALKLNIDVQLAAFYYMSDFGWILNWTSTGSSVALCRGLKVLGVFVVKAGALIWA